MIIQLKNRECKKELLKLLHQNKHKVKQVKTQLREYLVAIGAQEIDIRTIGNLNCVRDVHRVSDDYKLVSRKWKVEPTQIELSEDVKVGNNEFAIIAGPCAIESEKQILDTIRLLKKNGIKLMRGGVFKPRSSPYSFRGLGLEGLKIFHKRCSENGIKIITEVMEYEQIEKMYRYVDIFQVGARNFQNYNLLDALGETDKPVMIKRGLSGTINELLYAAEYVFSEEMKRYCYAKGEYAPLKKPIGTLLTLMQSLF